MAPTLSKDRKIWISIRNKIEELENKANRTTKENDKLYMLSNMWRDRNSYV